MLLYKTYYLKEQSNYFINKCSNKTYIKLNYYFFILIIKAGSINIKLTINNR